MRSLILLTLCLVCSACTRVAFTVPVGHPVPAKDLVELPGDWTGEKGIVWHVDHKLGTELYAVRWIKDGKEQSSEFVVTALGEDEVSILWAKDPELAAYVPLRIAAGEDALALLYPDEPVVARLVKEGKLKGVYDAQKKAWTISEGDWAAVLMSKDFWRIDVSMPFTKIKATKPAQESAPKTDAPVHEKPVAPAVGAANP